MRPPISLTMGLEMVRLLGHFVRQTNRSADPRTMRQGATIVSPNGFRKMCRSRLLTTSDADGNRGTNHVFGVDIVGDSAFGEQLSRSRHVVDRVIGLERGETSGTEARPTSLVGPERITWRRPV